MNALPYYKAYPRDFIEGTIGMDFETKGAYRLILDLIYMQSGRLPDDDRYISGVLGCSVKKWKSIRLTLLSMNKIYITGEFLANNRADELLETSSKFQDKQSKNSSKVNKNNDLQKPNQNHLRDKPEPESKNNKKSYQKEDLVLILSECLDEQTAMELIQHRDEIKKPLTPLSAKKMVPELKKVSDPKAAVDLMIRNGWQGINSAWIERQNGGRFTQAAPQPEPPKMREHDPKYDWPLGWPEEESLRYTWSIGSWFPRLGAKPNEPKCKIPRRFLDQWKAEGLDVYDSDEPPKEPEQEPFDFD